jgi:hypothetical protein
VTAPVLRVNGFAGNRRPVRVPDETSASREGSGPLPESATLASAAGQKLAAAHRAFLSASDLQHDFAAAPPPKPPPGWIEPLLRALKAAAPVTPIVFWVGVAAAAAMLLWLIVRDLPLRGRWRRRKPAAAPSPDWRPDANAAQALLDEADRLAAAGRFGEAVHILLFRSIEDIGARRPEAVRAALTSRDIVEAAPLSDTGRAAFRVIAEAVERSFFGGLPVVREEFERCRARYRDFALAEARP